MLSNYLTYSGCALAGIWGLIHVYPSKKLMAYFGKKSWESREILFMEWVLEGITLIFIGILVFLIQTYGQGPNPATRIVFRSCAAMLSAMATWTLITGAITSYRPLQFSPFITLTSGALIFFGSYF
jgi:hypothetical protein